MCTLHSNNSVMLVGSVVLGRTGAALLLMLHYTNCHALGFTILHLAFFVFLTDAQKYFNGKKSSLIESVCVLVFIILKPQLCAHDMAERKTLKLADNCVYMCVA